MIRTFFGDAERDFALGAKMIQELERTTGTGLGDLFAHLTTGNYRFAEITETIRLGMIGGGTSPQEADALVRAYVATEGNPLIEAQILAAEILTHLYVGNGAAE
ncbi:MAG: gene transfer agent family protein [Devosia sp.]